jgi:hypothetical protein
MGPGIVVIGPPILIDGGTTHTSLISIGSSRSIGGNSGRAGFWTVGVPPVSVFGLDEGSGGGGGNGGRPPS